MGQVTSSSRRRRSNGQRRKSSSLQKVNDKPMLAAASAIMGSSFTITGDGDDHSPVIRETKTWNNDAGPLGDRDIYSDGSVGEHDFEADIYYDTVEEETRFPLTMSAAHKFVEAEEFSRQVAENQEAARGLWSNSFSEPSASIFSVRGPDYLKTAGKNMKDLKIPSQDSPYEIIGVNMFHSTQRIKHVSAEVGEIRRFFQGYPADKDPMSLPTFLNVNWIMSPLFGKECWVVNHVFRLKSSWTSDAGIESAFRRFKQGTAAQKNGQFKYVFRIVDAPGPLKNTVSALGGERPVIIGKSLTTTYNEGANYLEINMDVSSSRIASAINGILLKNMQSVVCDCAWLLEGQRQEELPERILAAIRWNWNSAEEVVVKLDNAGERL